MRVPHRLGNPEQHAIGVRQQFVVAEPQDAIAQGLQQVRTCRVSGSAKGVLSAVEFNDQPCLWTAEVYDVHADRMLPTEFCALDLAVPETCPEPALGFRLVATEGPRVAARFLMDGYSHSRTHLRALTLGPLTLGPLTLPSPQRGEGDVLALGG